VAVDNEPLSTSSEAAIVDHKIMIKKNPELFFIVSRILLSLYLRIAAGADFAIVGRVLEGRVGDLKKVGWNKGNNTRYS
jgi:hypothetical protein